MKIRSLLGTTTSLFVLCGVAWTLAPRLFNSEVLKVGLTLLLGVLFVVLFMLLLGEHLVAVLRGSRRFRFLFITAAINLCLYLTAFAATYQSIGLIENIHGEAKIIHSFGISLYHSVGTFTTLGYGDFYPFSYGRVLAAIQAVSGYLTLGMLATVATSILSPYGRAGLTEEVVQHREQRAERDFSRL